jgi:chromosome segregation ATPase
MPAALPVKRPSTRDSKEKILQSFDQLSSEFRRLEAQRPAPAPAPAAVPGPNVAAARAPTFESITAELAALRQGFGAAASELSTKMVTEASKLEALRGGVAATVGQIRELYGIEAGEQTLDGLIAEYDQSAELFRLELTALREGRERELAEARRAFELERDEAERAARDEAEHYQKAREREAAEYDYHWQRRRELDRDAGEQRELARQAELAERAAEHERARAERDKSLDEQERQHAQAKAKVDEFAQRLEAAAKRAREEGAAIGRAQAKVKADLLAKEFEGEKRVYELRIKSLEEAISEQGGRLERLSTQLAQALSQAQHLAVKSIEGASNVSTFVAVKEIALEQAKNAPKGK